MAQDPTSSDVSTPEGGTYPSSEEVRAGDADEALTRSEIINEFGEEIGQELLDINISSLSGLMIIDDETKDALSPEAKAAVEAFFTLNEIEVHTVEDVTIEVAEVAEEVPAAVGGSEEEADVESEGSEEEAEGETPEEESVSEGDGDEDADSGEGAPAEAVAEGEAAEEVDTAGDVEEPVDEVDVEDGVVDELEEHEHEIENPLTYQEAKEKLEEIPYQELRDMAEADGLKPERSKKGVIVQLLSHWFPAPPVAPDEEPPMSARVRRIKESQQQ